jgi:hypothetical protein
MLGITATMKNCLKKSTRPDYEYLSGQIGLLVIKEFCMQSENKETEIFESQRAFNIIKNDHFDVDYIDKTDERTSCAL